MALVIIMPHKALSASCVRSRWRRRKCAAVNPPARFVLWRRGDEAEEISAVFVVLSYLSVCIDSGGHISALFAVFSSDPRVQNNTGLPGRQGGMESHGRDELKGPVLHIVVVGFHHKKGCQVREPLAPLLAWLTASFPNELLKNGIFHCIAV